LVAPAVEAAVEALEVATARVEEAASTVGVQAVEK
jgi:hypothetical protein